MLRNVVLLNLLVLIQKLIRLLEIMGSKVVKNNPNLIYKKAMFGGLVNKYINLGVKQCKDLIKYFINDC